MSAPHVHSWLLLPAVSFAGFILPGYLLTRLIPSASVALSSFLGSILILFWIVLGSQLLGLPLDLVHVAGGLAVVILGLTLAVLKKSAKASPPAGTDTGTAVRPDHFIYLAAAVLGLASILARSAIDPLSGYDNIFRWDGLSLEMLRTQSLSFYPAVSANAFAHYAWCDGIAPLVSSLNFWIYLGTGSTAPVMTSPRIALEAGLLFFGVFQFARVLWGSRAAGWTAMGMLATSSLALWAVAMGQETGLTTLTLVAMLYFLNTHGRSRRTSDAVWAGVAAAAGALSREYGLAYIVIGGVILLVQKSRRQDLFGFLAVAVILSAPWYLRNAWMTGNPLYSMDLLGLFPVNTVHKALMAAVGEHYSPSSVPRYLHNAYFFIMPLVFMGAVLLGALAGAFRLRLKSVPLLFAGLMIGALWFWSIGQTAGGWIYSMRVLSPMIAIAAILAGNCARLPAAAGIACSVMVLAVSADAAVRSWSLPNYPFTSPWSLSFVSWTESQKELHRLESPDMWAILSQAAQGKAIVVAHPMNHALIRRQGGNAVPLFSPRVDCMFDQHAAFADVIAKLKARNIRFVTWIEGSPTNEEFAGHYPFLRELLQDKFKIMTVGGLISVYDIEMIASLLQHPAATGSPR